jgi:hypothetical protein
MDNTQTPPEDSIFSLPSYKSSQFSSSATNVQMDPTLAMQQSQTRSTIASLFRGATIAVLALAVVGGGAWYMLANTAVSTQASIDLQQAVLGTVGTVNTLQNTFTLTNAQSEDPQIASTGITNWVIQLPPGASFTNTQAVLPVCYTISDLNRNLNEATQASCVDYLQPGDTVVIEYLIVKPETSSIITQKIIKAQ